MARKHGVKLRQPCLRVAKTAAMMARRDAHAKQFRRHQRQLRILRSRLGRIIRDFGGSPLATHRLLCRTFQLVSSKLRPRAV
jgi:hypothetical protein